MEPQSPTPNQPDQPTTPPERPTPPVAPAFSPAPTTITPPPSSQGSATPTSTPSPIVSHNTAVDAGLAPSSGGKKKLKFLVPALLALLVLIGGSAAAYFGVVVPNKPENVLKTALKNSFEEENVTAKIAFEGKTKDSPAYKFEATTKGNKPSKTLELDLKVTVTGVTVGAQARYVDKSAFVKVGDLSNVTGILGSVAPEYAQLATMLNDTVANKWFEIDSTLLKEAKADCVLDTNLTLDKADYEFLDKLYEQHTFIAIGNVSPETVNGQAATKYSLTVDNKKGAEFAEGLDNLPLLKKLDGCGEQSKDSKSTIDKEIKKIQDTDKTPINVWVDKKTKRISKILVEASEADRKDGVTAKVEVNFDYAPVKVSKPEGAKPITSLLGELGSLFGADDGGGEVTPQAD